MPKTHSTIDPQHAKDFFVALARVIEHYLPDERAHYHHCDRALRQQHIYRDLRTLQRSLRGWLRAVK